MFSKFKTREILIGDVGVGGDNPIRIQSMTTSDTRDVESTVSQILCLADNGCEIARVTVQGMKEAEACGEIKNSLIQKGYSIPLVADIHFYPPAAMRVVDFVDKVRINPGNFADRRATFKILQYTEESYADEIAKIEEKFIPLVEKCKKLKRAMRIGTNHGSLSDRIMNRFGDTPLGMVESALEYARICRDLDYHNFLFSMKASHTKVMIEAYRLLVEKMEELGWDYPLHLGVTEAGAYEDGRIKSAVGIGTLLQEGIGDTIRVSLTEDPWEEIDPCKRLIQLEERGRAKKLQRKINRPPPLHRDGTVLLTKQLESNQADGIVYEDRVEFGSETLPICDQSLAPFVLRLTGPKDWEKALNSTPAFILYTHFPSARAFVEYLTSKNLSIPIILHFDYTCSQEDFIIRASAEAGSLLIDELADGLALSGDYDPKFLEQFQFNLLQASRMRSSKTEFISCPGCGRTLFDLQEVSARIREKTAHLPGVSIAIMGCIVNGPGEMADADFGYVGSRPGKIDLYVGKTCVEKNIDMADADEKLIDLIKVHGRWVDSAGVH